MLGPLTISRNDVSIALPASRKVRALFAYLALSANAVTRSHLCELLWDVPNDPRGELRWCLSKIRRLVNEPGKCRVRTEADAVALDLDGCQVDALQMLRAADLGIAAHSLEQLRGIADGFGDEFLEGLELDRSPNFNTWLVAQRRRIRSFQIHVLEHLVERLADDEALDYLNRWALLSPLDERVHVRLLQVLARQQRFQEGKDHLEAIVRLFEAESLDNAPLRHAWQSTRTQPARPLSAHATIISEPAAKAVVQISPAAPHRGSIAVMPFTDQSSAPCFRGGISDALVHDVITRLAKLRSLFVIAQGTTFALHDRNIPPHEAGRMLNVEYVVSGLLRRDGSRLTVQVELSEVRSGRIVWAEIFNHSVDDAFLVLDEIGDRIVAAIASEVEAVERNRAILKPPNSLNAWEAHHRGLWHMYRFNRMDNEQAQRFFEIAVGLDPTFARAYAGLSFTHFQKAFQGWAERQPEVDRAFEAAGQSLMVDDRDPAAHWAMGRALWLRGSYDQSFRELETSVDLSPNFAQGHYTLAFVHSQVGNPGTAIAASDQSRRLSPFDPMLFGMLGARAMALVRQRNFEEAARWSVDAATRPNAHAHILAIAALSLALAGRIDQAREYLTAIHRTLPRYGVRDFLTAMRFAREDEVLFQEAARRIGMDSN
ncbi:transcriptional regulator [Microvirga sp. VF16]|nr:BTAD domain-containing putative transcriptional regulator [Microvirga sp. VF16]QRM31994.1 transcriptional regulator [Microvirga sp. VF16]